MTVYIAQNKLDMNLSSAVDFGEIKYLIDIEETPPSYLPQHSLQKICERLEDYNPETDYLLDLRADVLAFGLAFFVIGYRYGKVNMLRWERKLVDGKRNRKEGFYIPVTIDIDREVRFLDKGVK